ncbi:SDR family NAD(P)-dependent oxidoreductase [Bradyrhizobium sp. CB1717]|uniref:SDR family NAD(P)-dependent oxidoreductase n=1 Tax=Bradyrhizobium sp. CB1717 TaxID=3039154 RepID=UPI0032C23B88
MDPAAPDKVVHEIEAGGRKAIAINADVSNEEDVRSMFARAIDHFGTLHIVVNNAGLQRDEPFHDMTIEQWNKVQRQSHRPVPLCPGIRPRVQETRCREGHLGRRQALSHDLCPPGDTLGWARELCGIQRRRHADDAKRRPGVSSASTAWRRAPFGRSSIGPPGRPRRPAKIR